MANEYIVSYGRGHESTPVETWGEALLLAASYAADGYPIHGITNSDRIDVCPDAGCQDCNRDGLTEAEREELQETGLV